MPTQRYSSRLTHTDTQERRDEADERLCPSWPALRHNARLHYQMHLMSKSIEVMPCIDWGFYVDATWFPMPFAYVRLTLRVTTR